ncbi:MAG: DUF2069 domain-containing protein [Steroidobacteraceae bacterium]
MNSLNVYPRYARRCVLATWTILFALVCARQLQQGFNLTQVGWALFFALPLLVALPGLLQGKRYTHAWATLCVLPYFVIGITEGVANVNLRTWALSLLGASLLWFFALLFFLRATRTSAETTEA